MASQKDTALHQNMIIGVIYQDVIIKSAADIVQNHSLLSQYCQQCSLLDFQRGEKDAQS